jgi:hypothetical protein
MGEKYYFRWLTRYDRIRQNLSIKKGKVINFIVQYEIYFGNKWHPIIRYDTAHGFFHRDTIFPDGTKIKTPIPGMTFNEAIVFSENDLLQNWQQYRKNYEEKKNDGK